MTLIEAAAISDDRIVRRKCWDKDRKFKFSGSDIIYCSDAIADDWEPVIEKKKKTVVMYQAVVKFDNDTIPEVTQYLFKNEDEAKDCYHHEFIKLLTDRPIEIEVEDDKP